ncbi:hypothetical protein FOA52_014913 [Chlamydomonas sp. UWO 241]|nr:hypothetical protein FOA52_014913 [Chlamydomonas sp. UWO 241]
MSQLVRGQLVRDGRSYMTDDSRRLVGQHLLVDTLQLARRFESTGLERADADKLAEYITEIIVSNKAKMDDSFVDKNQMQKVMMEQQMLTTVFKSELEKSQELQGSNLTKDLERQQTFLDKMRAETKHEIDRLTASQRLDLNLEKGRMRDDLQLMRDKVTDLEIKVDRDINELRSLIEKAKNDTMKVVITILGTFSAVAFTISRFLEMGR